MNKAVASSAGLLAMFALFIHTHGGSGSEHARESTQSSGNAVATAPQPSASASSGEAGPWNATRQYFHREPKPRADGYAACRPTPEQGCSRSELLDLYGMPGSFDLRTSHAVIATVPDPLHTRMAMETDRSLDAIQQAVFDSGYELASEWLPWTVNPSLEEPTAKPHGPAATDWEKLPGLLVFRPHFRPYRTNVNSLLLVFVAGETPSAGINGFQFAAARDTVFALEGNQPHDLYVAGPNFSGSLLSLTRLLEESPLLQHAEIRAGTASSSEYARAMLIDLHRHGFSIDSTRPGLPSVDFHGSNLPSVSFHTQFQELARRINLKPEQVAEITEDETGFAFAFIPENVKHPGDVNEPEASPTIYRYPRNIAQLRNTYNDAAFAPAQPSGANATTPLDFR